MNLAYLAVEDDNYLISADDKKLILITDILHESLQNEEQRSSTGFGTVEMLEIINLLAAIDSNKVYTILSVNRG